MVSPEECISRTEGVIEQINERKGRLEDLTREIIRMPEKKSGKTDMRFMFVVVITLMVALFSVVLGLLGVISTKIQALNTFSTKNESLEAVRGGP